MRGTRGRRHRVGAALVVAAAVLTASTDLGHAGPPSGDGPNGPAVEALPLDVSGLRFTPALDDPDQRVTVMVEMEGEPVAVQQRQARDRGEELSDQQRADARAALAARQAEVVDDIGALGGSVLSHLHDAYNGIKVQVPARALAQLATLPGARDVLPVARQVPSATRLSPLRSALAGWQASGAAATGRDVTIAVIDTGVDYLHAHLGGAGRPELYAANDPAVVEPGSFPTAKVVGGYDFVGDAYDPSSDDARETVPRPDADPMDCEGHGTHVAGTAAGTGVLADGRTYPGPYDAAAGAQPFAIGPGVAPEAKVLALKVFGCEGSTDVVVEAIDWAVAHGADVINLSLGAGFGTERDPSSVAATNAVLAGVVVVAAAGNSGDARYIAGSPAAGRGVIAVGAIDTVETLPMARMTGGELAVPLLNGNEATIDPPITAPLTVLADDPLDRSRRITGLCAGGLPGRAPGRHRRLPPGHLPPADEGDAGPGGRGGRGRDDQQRAPAAAPGAADPRGDDPLPRRQLGVRRPARRGRRTVGHHRGGGPHRPTRATAGRPASPPRARRRRR